MINPRIISHDSIVRHLIDGTISIDSAEEYQRLLNLFPKQPVLYRAYADFLNRRNQAQEAVGAFHEAAKMFLDERLVLQAVMCILQSWRLRKPIPTETRSFYRSLQQVEVTNNLVHCFLKALNYAELIAFMSKIERLQVPPRTVIQKFGATVEGLFFIVSGKINEIPCHSLDRYEIGPAGPMAVCRGENDFFGHVLDPGQKTFSQNYIQGVTHVELAFLRHDRLEALCRKHTGVRKQLKALLDRSEKTDKPRGATIRRTVRSEVKCEVTLTLMPWSQNKIPMHYQAFATDISLGGACVMITHQDHHPLPSSLEGAPVTISLGTANQSFSLYVVGEVSWSKEMAASDLPTRVLGLQFKPMSPKLGGLLVLFAKILSEDYEARADKLDTQAMAPN